MATKETPKQEQEQAKTEGTKTKIVKKTIKRYKAARAVDEKDKIAPQAKLIVEVLAKCKEPQTLKQLTEAALAAGLKTRQEPSRIFTFYRSSLVNAGLVQEILDEVEEEVVVSAQSTKGKPAGKDEKGKKVSA